MTLKQLRELYDKPAPQPAQKIRLKGSKAKAGETQEEALARIVAEVMARHFLPVVKRLVEEVHAQPDPDPQPLQAAGHNRLGWHRMFNSSPNGHLNGSSRIV